MAPNDLLTVEDAAAHLRLSKHTLNRWRTTGDGPPFVKYGPKLVRYSLQDLEDWKNSSRRNVPTACANDNGIGVLVDRA